MAERLTFTLTGRDELSRVLNGTASSADRLRLQLAGITADADGKLRDLEGNLLTTDEAARRLDATLGGTRTSFNTLGEAGDKLGESLRANLISLLPAAIPMAASLASSAAVLAGQLGAVAVAAGAYALALGPQIGAISEALEAQEKYEAAVEAGGAGSAAAVKAQAEYQQQLAKLPPATREAAVAVGLLKDSYKEWSDSLSGDVMGPFTKGVAVANALLPETTGLVKGSATQFDRLITIVAGGISTPGFDALNGRFTTFANETLDNSIDKLTIFLAKLNAGEYDNGPVSEFFDYSREVGPEVWSTLENVAEAVLNLVEAGADVGVGLLDVVNFLTGIVSAVPPEALATILQLAIAIKAVQLAGVGLDAARAAMAALGVQFGIMSTAAAGSTGVIAGTTAAVGALSRTAKIAMAGTGIGLLLIGLDMLASGSQESKPDVDKLAISLTELGNSGELGGEAVRAFGDDLSGLADAFQKVADPQGIDQVQQAIISFFGTDSTPVKAAKENVDALDKALASMVSNGQADLAAEAMERVSAKLQDQGLSADVVEDQLNDYKDALAGQALEQELAAQSMGIFGEQAQEVQAQLDAQKQSADGLRQSIIALNDVNRSAYDAQTRFEAGLDSLTESFQEHGATLERDTEAGRANADAMSQAAAANDEMLASGLAAGESLASMTERSETLRATMLELAEATGMSDTEAQEYVNTLLGTPESIRTDIILEREDAISGLYAVQTAIDETPGSHTVTVDTLNAAAINALEAVGLKTRQLPDGRTEVYTANGSAIDNIDAVSQALNNINGKTAVTYVTTLQSGPFQGKEMPAMAAGGLYTGTGARRGYSSGGRVRGPGTPTSDEVLAPWLSVDEYVIRATSVDKYGVDLFDALNAGTLPVPVGRAAVSPGLPAATAAPAVRQADTRPPVTYNVYPRASVISAEDLRLLQRQEEARQRVGRPR
ncbi:PspA/IM30 family protein [Streptomyces sp. NPDC059477]|uniref:PspA/IM30 family protein n=1 Tax=Streptomyces sp. NPDC059477 TaxID=3346847 RepID=UPI0036A63D6A